MGQNFAPRGSSAASTTARRLSSSCRSNSCVLAASSWRCSVGCSRHLSARQRRRRWLGGWAPRIGRIYQGSGAGAAAPGAGFARTLRPATPGGRSWLAVPSRPVSGELAGPDGQARPAAGYRAADGSVLVLVGGPPDEDAPGGSGRAIPDALECAASRGRGQNRRPTARLEIRAAELARALAVDLDSARRELEDSRVLLVAANRPKTSSSPCWGMSCATR